MADRLADVYKNWLRNEREIQQSMISDAQDKLSRIPVALDGQTRGMAAFYKKQIRTHRRIIALLRSEPDSLEGIHDAERIQGEQRTDTGSKEVAGDNREPGE